MNESSEVEVGAFQRDEPEKVEKTPGMSAIENFMKGGGSSTSEKPETDTPEPQAPAASPPQIEASLISELEKINASPEASYEERLERVECSLEEARIIVDALMTAGYYEKRYQLTKKYSVVMRTRGVSDQERLQNAIEANVPQYAITMNEMTSKYNLAACLAELQASATVKFGPDDFDGAIKVVNKLSLPLFNALVNVLARFDALTFTVLSKGVIENF